jgi:hypothetical protein
MKEPRLLPEWYVNKRYSFKSPWKMYAIVLAYYFTPMIVFLVFLRVIFLLIEITYFIFLVGDLWRFIASFFIMLFIAAMVTLIVVLAVHGSGRENKPRFVRRVGISEADLHLEFDEPPVITIPWKNLKDINHECLEYLDNGVPRELDLGMLDRRTLRLILRYKDR